MIKPGQRPGLYARYGKRALDVAVSGTALLALAPVLIGIGAATRVAMGTPVLYKQRRPGRAGRVFTILKFRTMTDVVRPDGTPRSDNERITRFGEWLRSTSMDELPELINVFRGDMSLVGPRPLLVKYLSLYDQRQHKRHAVRPGLTGLAQVSGRNCLDWLVRLELDVRYVETISVLSDLRILLRTVSTTLRREGIAEPGQSTMSEFTGSPQRDADPVIDGRDAPVDDGVMSSEM
ncbi:MAG: sugar transferase [Nannocystaceae bacterium]